MNKRLAGIRKVIGVLYRPTGSAVPKAGRFAEWLPCTSLSAAHAFKGCKAIDVQGDCLDPIARNGQKVLVDAPLPMLSACPNGELAVLEFRDDAGKYYQASVPWQTTVILVSPNPVDGFPRC